MFHIHTSSSSKHCKASAQITKFRKKLPVFANSANQTWKTLFLEILQFQEISFIILTNSDKTDSKVVKVNRNVTFNNDKGVIIS